jgi:hypothetical protein
MSFHKLVRLAKPWVAPKSSSTAPWEVQGLTKPSAILRQNQTARSGHQLTPQKGATRHRNGAPRMRLELPEVVRSPLTSVV